MPCVYGWQFDPNGKWSIIAEWELVCSRNYLGYLLMTINSIGRIIGTVLFSFLVDKIGRKPTFFIVLTWYLLLGVVSVFMQSITAYIVVTTLRSLAGVALFQVCIIQLF